MPAFAGLGVEGTDAFLQPLPGNQAVHPLQEQLPAGLPLLALEFQGGERWLVHPILPPTCMGLPGLTMPHRRGLVQSILRFDWTMMLSQYMTHPNIGRFVWTFDEFGLGQVTRHQEGCCTVLFFESAADSFERDYEVDQVKRAYLGPQTRVYLCDENGIWSVGRITDYLVQGDEIWYGVRFPNKTDRRIHEADLRVRCLLPVDNPAAILAAGGMESQYLHDRRQAALECLTTSRAITYGLTGLLSASVELLPHQVEVVRRVLDDPVQRYLLADEVGLGKTIEACAIVKQAIFDNPSEKVLVLAPTSLTAQWSRELAWRFFVQPPQHRLRVLPFDELDTVDPSEVDTLVIDEAHNLIPADPANDAGYESIERLASRAHRLLLISATPVLGNEATLLALLHLLDPQTYRLDEEGAFLDKVRRRQEIARLLLALNSNQRPVFLRRTLQSLRKLVYPDKVAARLIADVENAIGTGENDVVAENVHALHRHIGDTYRLHQRLIRTRRRDLPEHVLVPRAAVLDDLQEDDDERTPLLVDALDQWRQRSLEVLATMQDGLVEAFEAKMAHRYAKLHEALGTSVETCTEEIRSQLDDIRTGREVSFGEDKESLEFALCQANEETEETRSGFAKRVIERAFRQIDQNFRRPRIVVFGSSTEFISGVADQVEAARIAHVFRVVETSKKPDVLDVVDGFFRCPDAAVLFCDRRGEEGLNLQFAHGIVHLDLPLAPARIEQRIGRLDRFGREHFQLQEIHHWVIAPYADYFHPWEAWFELLRDEFKVFHQSISEVQFLLEELQDSARLALYHRGAEGIRGIALHVREAITLERQRLDEQYALDSRTIRSGDTEDAFQSIKFHDTARSYNPIHNWLTEVLNFGHESLTEDFPNERAFRLHWTHRTLLPKEPWQAIIHEEYLAQPMTYERRNATYRRGLRLVRPGLELADNMEKVLRWDDRGTAFATWRLDPRWSGEGRGTWLGFRLIYMLEADFESARSVLGEEVDEVVTLSLRRRMDSLLPPWATTLDVDIDANPVIDPLLLEILDRPYSDHSDEHGRRDYNLGSRRDALYESIGFPELSDACGMAKNASEALLRSSPQFQKWIDGNVRSAISKINVDNERLERRNEAIIRETGRAGVGLERDIRFNTAIATALGSPLVRLDSFGLFLVSDVPPRAAEAGNSREGR